jgi:hypothetical protein
LSQSYSMLVLLIKLLEKLIKSNAQETYYRDDEIKLKGLLTIFETKINNEKKAFIISHPDCDGGTEKYIFAPDFGFVEITIPPGGRLEIIRVNKSIDTILSHADKNQNIVVKVPLTGFMIAATSNVIELLSQPLQELFIYHLDALGENYTSEYI